MGIFPLRFQQLRNGLPSLNVAVPALKLINVRDVQKVQQNQRSLNKCTIWFWTTGDSSPSFSTIKKLAAEFKRGRTSLEFDQRERRTNSATTPEIIEQVHDMFLDDWRMKLREVADTIGISKERVGYTSYFKLSVFQ